MDLKDLVINKDLFMIVFLGYFAMYGPTIFHKNSETKNPYPLFQCCSDYGLSLRDFEGLGMLFFTSLTFINSD